jgi:glucose/mannose-6-phosphate isomerase
MTVLDTLGMFDAAYGLPEQVETAAAALASGVEGLPAADEVSNVLVLGMGGSGISGDVLSAVAGPVCSVPILVSKEYELPGFVDSGTLVFAVSFSGNTEETIESATEAAHAGAKVVTVSAGGRLAELGETWGAPHVSLPGDIVMPRAAIGAASVPLLVMLGQIGLCGGVEADIDATVKQLRHRRDELSKPRNSAEELARHIGRTFPIVYGGGPIGAVAAQRWKGEFNENAKAPAFSNRVPEACHNEAAGWGQHGDVTRQVFTLIFLRHDHEHPQVARRFDLLRELMLEVVGSIHVVVAQGDGLMAQLFDLVLQGDLVSLHLAAQQEVDPGPIPALEFIKAGLR